MEKESCWVPELEVFQFDPEFKVVGHIGIPQGGYQVKHIKGDQMFFGADAKFAYLNGGFLTQFFLEELAKLGVEQDKIIIDSRYHMLMPGFFPCIPGWHHDDVPRSRSDGQPNYLTPEYRTDHYMMVVDAGTNSMTEFYNKSVMVDSVPLGKVVYEQWDRELNEYLEMDGPGAVTKAESGQVIQFSDRAFHRGVAATGSGWRFFIRATVGSDRPFFNEIRRQVQVYMSNLGQGW